jgi:hypothetical protein
VGVDGGNDPVPVGDDVPDQDRDEDRRLQGNAQDLDVVADHRAGQEGKEQEGGRCERHRPIPRPGIGVAEPREDQAEECRGERGPCTRACPRACFLLLLHRG